MNQVDTGCTASHQYLLLHHNTYKNVCYNIKIQSRCIYILFEFFSKPELLRTIGARLCDQRLAQKLSQARLAGMAGLSLGALRNLEKDGRCSLETLVSVVQALGLTSELKDLFVLKRQSIEQMERAEAANRRQRAPKREPV